MKRLNLTFTILALVLTFSTISFAQDDNDHDCNGGKKSDGIYYTSCWDDTGDDTTRIQAAIDKIAVVVNAFGGGSGAMVVLVGGQWDCQ